MNMALINIFFKTSADLCFLFFFQIVHNLLWRKVNFFHKRKQLITITKAMNESRLNIQKKIEENLIKVQWIWTLLKRRASAIFQFKSSKKKVTIKPSFMFHINAS